MPELQFSRRKLLGSAALAGLAPAIASKAMAAHHSKNAKATLKKRGVMLFQGDSITDAGRNKKDPKPNEQKSFGKGYAWMAGSQLLISNPAHKLTLYNRGISGNKVHQLATRWDKDCLDLKPDVLSILIGVNDIWHGLNGRYDGTVKTYENDFNALLERTKKALPKVQLVICEPFVLKCGAVTEKWFPEFNKYRTVAKKNGSSPSCRIRTFPIDVQRSAQIRTTQSLGWRRGSSKFARSLPNGSFSAQFHTSFLKRGTHTPTSCHESTSIGCTQILQTL